MQRGGGGHTVQALDGKGWCNTVAGRVTTRHTLKRTAVPAGRAAARTLKVELTIHRADGRIAEKNSYGRDSFPPKDGR